MPHAQSISAEHLRKETVPRGGEMYKVHTDNKWQSGLKSLPLPPGLQAPGLLATLALAPAPGWVPLTAPSAASQECGFVHAPLYPAHRPEPASAQKAGCPPVLRSVAACTSFLPSWPICQEGSLGDAVGSLFPEQPGSSLGEHACFHCLGC